MTAWQELLQKSTAPANDIAWEHLISPAPGGGTCPPEYDPDAGFLPVLDPAGFTAVEIVQGVVLVSPEEGVIATQLVGFAVVSDSPGVAVDTPLVGFEVLT